MKYKVGDKVRVRKDLEAVTKFEQYDFVDGMEKYRGKIVEISGVWENLKFYRIKEDGGDYIWVDEMFEPVMTNFDKVREMINIEDVGSYSNPFCKVVHKIRKESNCDTRFCNECKEWLKQPYEEPKKEILYKRKRIFIGSNKAF